MSNNFMNIFRTICNELTEFTWIEFKNILSKKYLSIYHIIVNNLVKYYAQLKGYKNIFFQDELDLTIYDIYINNHSHDAPIVIIDKKYIRNSMGLIVKGDNVNYTFFDSEPNYGYNKCSCNTYKFFDFNKMFNKVFVNNILKYDNLLGLAARFVLNNRKFFKNKNIMRLNKDIRKMLMKIKK